MTSKIMQMAKRAVKKQNPSKYNRIQSKHLKLSNRWGKITPHLTVKIDQRIQDGFLRIERNKIVIYLTQNSTKFRIKSRLDWVHYDPIDLAKHINSDDIEYYYYMQLGDTKSYPNDWKRIQEEHDLKTYYANRVGRNTDLLDNI
tara:strand:- start:16 stop:447 length:432 start_codon:yes stop_codon:yes gene_type:complete